MKIGNFDVSQHGDKTEVDYRRSFKDWLDILVYLFLGTAASIFIILLYLHADFRQWIFWVISALFGFFAFLKLAEGCTRLTQPTRSIITIDHKEQKLIAKFPYLQKTVFDLRDISRIQLSGVNERIRTSKTTQVRTYCKIEILDKYGQLKTILLVNTSHLFRTSNKIIETDVYDKGQKITKFLSEQTKTRYQWMGFHDASK